tara:strand:- start:2350 stop:2742 length:393 start_codon:yes stop_codon:yes gene_type:complete
MENIVDRFEKHDFPARERQPYYYDVNGHIKKNWSKEVVLVGGKGNHGQHKQPGYFLHLDDSPGPRQVVYGGNKGEAPKKGDTLHFVFNEDVSKELDYPAYSVILKSKPSFFNRLLSKLGILKNKDEHCNI